MEKSVPSSKKRVLEKISKPVNSEKKQKVNNELKKENNGTGNRKISPSVASASKYRIQLASVKSDKLAQLAWKRYRQKFAKSLGDLEPYIEKVLIPAKGTFHRVQAGVLNKIKAQNICSVLINKKQPCIIIRIKSCGD